MSTAVMWSKSKPDVQKCRIPIWLSQSPLPHCDDRATLQGIRILSSILKIVFRHIFFVFFNAVWTLTSGGFRIVSDTLVSIACRAATTTQHGVSGVTARPRPLLGHPAVHANCECTACSAITFSYCTAVQEQLLHGTV